jgi:5-methylcytosine-specific restriction protein A
MAGRTNDEWMAIENPNLMPPARVRLRIFEKFGGVCQLTGRKIMPGEGWDLDHITPLEDGGENRESNLHPVLRAAHREKTARENSQRAKERRKREKFLGIERPKAKLPGSKDSKFKRTIGGRTVLRERDHDQD